MTFIDYSTYINSEAWKYKRELFICTCPRSEYCGICRIPYQKGFHVHHLTYERLGRERFKDLMVVCPECHENIHKLHDRRVARARCRQKKWPTIKSTTKRLQRKIAKQIAKEQYRIKTRKKQTRKRAKRKTERGAKNAPPSPIPTQLTEAEIEAGKSAKGGYTRKQLAKWGISWPPVAGWKRALIAGKPIPKRIQSDKLA